MLYSRKTNVPRYEYQLCHATIKLTSSIKDLGVFLDSKSYFHSHVEFLFSEFMNLLGLLLSITFRFVINILALKCLACQ
jgi:hypothetical protein